jgi:hypothetical protein
MAINLQLMTEHTNGNNKVILSTRKKFNYRPKNNLEKQDIQFNVILHDDNDAAATYIHAYMYT